MTTIPAWAAPWVGIPYVDKGRGPDAYDCWGLICAVYRAQFGIALPSYDDTYRDGDDWRAIGVAVRVGLREGWQRTEQPRGGDLLVLAIARRPWHCALMLDAVHFLHAAPGDSTVIDRLDSPRWARRIEGIYRHD